MTISFTNIWKDKILDQIRTFLRNEFKTMISCYVGEYQTLGNESIRIEPISSELIDMSDFQETRKYTVQVSYYFNNRNTKKTSLDHILRRVSHIEALFQNNGFKNDSSGNVYYNAKLVSCNVDAPIIDEEGFSGKIVRWVWEGSHKGNIS